MGKQFKKLNKNSIGVEIGKVVLCYLSKKPTLLEIARSQPMDENKIGWN